MAMKFNEADLDSAVESHFKPAVAATGFELRKINDGQAAGLIDDKLRVAIRQSRFVVADLTHHNNGAYWEAGYAEGLGKPVIYTCRKDVFEDKRHGTHFDTNHHLTVVWEPGELDVAAQQLQDTIRATLPDEAQQEG
jgi:nucleoside 2-deoxyribosyltransferase